MKYLLTLFWIMVTLGGFFQSGCTSTSATMPAKSSDIVMETFHANNSFKIITAHNRRNAELWALSLSINEHWRSAGLWNLEVTPMASSHMDGSFRVRIEDFSILQEDGRQLKILKYADLFNHSNLRTSGNAELEQLTRSNPSLNNLLGQQNDVLAERALAELKRDYLQEIDTYPGVPLRKHYFIFEPPADGQSFITLRFTYRGKHHDVKFPI